MAEHVVPLSGNLSNQQFNSFKIAAATLIEQGNVYVSVGGYLTVPAAANAHRRSSFATNLSARICWSPLTDTLGCGGTPPVISPGWSKWMRSWVCPLQYVSTTAKGCPLRPARPARCW